MANWWKKPTCTFVEHKQLLFKIPMRILIILSNNVPIICDLNKYFHRVLPTNLPFPFRILFNVINVRTLNLFLGIQVLFSDLCKYRDIHKSINIIKKKYQQQILHKIWSCTLGLKQPSHTSSLWNEVLILLHIGEKSCLFYAYISWGIIN